MAAGREKWGACGERKKSVIQNNSSGELSLKSEREMTALTWIGMQLIFRPALGKTPKPPIGLAVPSGQR